MISALVQEKWPIKPALGIKVDTKGLMLIKTQNVHFGHILFYRSLPDKVVNFSGNLIFIINIFSHL